MDITSFILTASFLSLIGAPEGAVPTSATKTGSKTTPSSKLHFQEKIEARVGKEIITSTDLEMARQAVKSSLPHLSDSELNKQVLEKLVNEKLVPEYLNQFGAGVSDSQVEQRINGIQTSNGFKNQEEFRAALAQQGLTFDRFKIQVKAQLEQMQFMQFMRRQIEDRLPKINDKSGDRELLAYYKNHQDKYGRNIEVQLQGCVVPVGADPKKSEQIALEYQKKPSTFDACVKKVSTSPSAKQNKGLIGAFQRGTFREDVEAKVFSLKANQVAMIPMQGAIQLLKVVKVKDLGPQKFEDLKEKIREEIANELVQKEIDSTLADLKSRVYIKI